MPRLITTSEVRAARRPNLTVVPADAELKNDKEAPENNPECVVCLENTPVCLITPCNHMVLCIACSIKLAKGKAQGSVKCPTCRKGINEIKRLYF